MQTSIQPAVICQSHCVEKGVLTPHVLGLGTGAELQRILRRFYPDLADTDSVTVLHFHVMSLGIFKVWIAKKLVNSVADAYPQQGYEKKVLLLLLLLLFHSRDKNFCVEKTSFLRHFESFQKQKELFCDCFAVLVLKTMLLVVAVCLIFFLGLLSRVARNTLLFSILQQRLLCAIFHTPCNR